MVKRKDESGFAGRIRQAIRDSGLSLNAIGQRAGMDHSRLSRFMRGERDLTLDAASRICKVLGIELTAPSPAEMEGTPAERTALPAAEDLEATKKAKEPAAKKRGSKRK